MSHNYVPGIAVFSGCVRLLATMALISNFEN